MVSAPASPGPDSEALSGGGGGGGPWFGGTRRQWVPPTVAPRAIDWPAAERAAAAGQLPHKVLGLLRQVAGRAAPSKRTGAGLGSGMGTGARKWAGTCPGTQPHLDRLRAEVLSGARPELAQLYIAKLRPKSAPGAGAGAAGAGAPARTDTAFESAAAGAVAPVRLSKAEKRQNHLASEHKRRMNIRRGYQDLAAHLPALRHHDRDEIKVGMAMECQFLRQGTSVFLLRLLLLLLPFLSAPHARTARIRTALLCAGAARSGLV